MVLLIIFGLFFIIYMVYEIYSMKKKLVRLIQENAVLWQVIKEIED